MHTPTSFFYTADITIDNNVKNYSYQPMTLVSTLHSLT